MALKQIYPTALTASDETAKEEVGVIRVEANGKAYRYIRNCGSRTLVKGNAVNLVLKSANYYQACACRLGTNVHAGEKNAPLGILVGSVRKGHYGWAQFQGNFLGTTARVSQSGAHIAGSMVGLASGKTAKLTVLSSSAHRKHFRAIGVNLAAGSETFLKGIYLYGA